MNIFEEVKQQLNIMQVIEHFGLKVNRAKKFICPFHNDHKPSASIKNDYFYCFVCGAGGDLITFTAKYLSISNLEACRELVRVFNLNIDISFIVINSNSSFWRIRTRSYYFSIIKSNINSTILSCLVFITY